MCVQKNVLGWSKWYSTNLVTRGPPKPECFLWSASNNEIKVNKKNLDVNKSNIAAFNPFNRKSRSLDRLDSNFNGRD